MRRSAGSLAPRALKQWLAGLAEAWPLSREVVRSMSSQAEPGQDGIAAPPGTALPDRCVCTASRGQLSQVVQNRILVLHCLELDETMHGVWC